MKPVIAWLPRGLPSDVPSRDDIVSRAADSRPMNDCNIIARSRRLLPSGFGAARKQLPTVALFPTTGASWLHPEPLSTARYRRRRQQKALKALRHHRHMTGRIRLPSSWPTIQSSAIYRHMKRNYSKYRHHRHRMPQNNLFEQRGRNYKTKYSRKLSRAAASYRETK